MSKIDKFRIIIREEVKRIFNEIGNTVEVYNWKEVYGGKKYTFNTENYNYLVRIKRFGQEKLSVIFMVEGDDGYSLNKVTNEGSIFKVVSTVLDIVEYVWRNRFDFYNNPENIQYILFSGYGDKEKKKVQKEKIYKKFIKKQFPGVKVESSKLGIKIYPKDVNN